MTKPKSVCTVLIVCAVGFIICIFNNQAAWLNKTTHRPTRFTTSAGTPLTAFFEGIPTNEKYAAMAHRPRRRKLACEQDSGVMAGVMRTLGVSMVVHAQGQCDGAGCAKPCGWLLDSEQCDCGFGSHVIAYQDPTTSSYKNTTTYSCNTPSMICDCEVEICFDCT